MTLAERASEILGGDILLRLRADATGLDADVSAKLTAAERSAERSAQRVGAASGRSVAAAEKVQAAQLRVTAAEERYNAALLATEKNTARIASAEASLIGARGRARRAEAEQLSSQQRGQQRGLGVGSTVGIVAATYGLTKLFGMYREGVASAERLQVADRQTRVELAATGDTAGVTAEHVRALAEALAHTAGVQDTVVQGAENMLLTFTGIQNVGPDKIFDRAARAAVDMAVAFRNAHGGEIDVATQAKALGLALNDPTRGLDRLRQSGVAFTAQQREQVKTLAESGHTLEAQALILDLVNQKVGGSAKAYGEGAQGSADRAKVAYEELSRTLATNLLPIVTRVEHAFTTVFEHKDADRAAVALAVVTAGVVSLVAAERALKVLRQSEFLGVAARLLGYRSLERAQVQLAAAEDRHAEAAGRVAVAEDAAAVATERSAAVASGATGAQGRTAAPAAVRTGRAFGVGGALGLVGRAAGAIGLADLIAENVGHHFGSGGFATAFRMGQANAADNRLRSLFGSQYQGANYQQRQAVDALRDEAKGALNAAQKGHYGELRQAVIDVTAAYARYDDRLLDVNHDTADLMTGQRGLNQLLQQHRNAIADTDLALAQSADRRLATARATYQSALAFQRQVASGDPTAVGKVEQIIGVGQAGLFDPVAATAGTATGSQLASVRGAKVSSASAIQRVQLDEARLVALRSTGKATALQLRAAEDALSTARARAAVAGDRVGVAEQKVADATKSTALSVGDVLKRAADQDRAQQATAAEARQLVRKGVSEPVLAELYQLDQKAPGTFANIAAHITAAGARRLDKDQQIAAAARRSLEEAFAGANTRAARRAAARAAVSAANAWQQAYLAAIKSPQFWDLVNTDLGRLLIGNAGVLPKGSGPGAGGTGSTGQAPRTVLFGGLPGVTYNFNGPTTFTDPAAAAKTAQRQRVAALSP